MLAWTRLDCQILHPQIVVVTSQGNTLGTGPSPIASSLRTSPMIIEIDTYAASGTDSDTAAGTAAAAEIDAFLARHADSSMFLRSNLARSGLVNGDQPFQGAYAVARNEAGEIRGVVAQYWNGLVVLQVPSYDPELDSAKLAQAAVKAGGRPVRGFAGPRAQVVSARAALGMDGRQTRLDSDERMYAVDLAKLQVPDPLKRGVVTCRQPLESELNLLIEWRVAYAIDQLGSEDTPALRRQAKEEILRFTQDNHNWVLLCEDKPVAYAAFNAVTADMVQIGGVWTPPLLRSNGFARYCVAGALQAAHENGKRRAVLFTGRSSWPALRAYVSLGFKEVGDYSLVLFAD